MKPILFFLMFLPFVTMAQLDEHFDDYDFTRNPVWWGCQDKFIINQDRQLQLNDVQAGKAYLATSVKCDTSMEWQFWVRADFNPSSNNFIRIYLLSDKEDLTKALHGYFLQLGESGTKDAPEIFRQDSTLLVSVCRGADGEIASSFQIRIKIIRTQNGVWQLFVDPGGKSDFRFEASGLDKTYFGSSVFGLYCQYTSSNAKRVYFDDIYAGPKIIDKTPPKLQYVSVQSDSVLTLNFDEGLMDSIADNPRHYRLLSTGAYPRRVELSEHSHVVSLSFAQRFANGVQDTLIVSGLKDLAGNLMKSKKCPFLYYKPQAFDVEINEVMPDPNPPVDLPEFEYIELFNRNRIDINLKGWKLKIGKSIKIFDSVTIPAGGYLIIARQDAAGVFSEYGAFYGFKSLNLPNNGQTLALLSPSEKVISRVSYAIDWYKNPDKSSGGWSLEQINPSNICSGKENWTASINPNGGTPGSVNSVDNKIILHPRIDQFRLISRREIELGFNQQMDRLSVLELSNYKVNPETIYPDSVALIGEWPSMVHLHFLSPLDSCVLYKLTLSKALRNCQGEPLVSDTSILFGLPEKAMVNDIVINEVLFNPLAGGVDYVELYNRSKKIIDLSTLQLGTVKFNQPAANDSLFYKVSAQQQFFLPHSYLLLTSSPGIVKEQYFTEDPDAFLQMSPFPSYPDKEGCVIVQQSGITIDWFHYSADMQYPLLNFQDGVALERVSFTGKTNDRNNWHSAAQSVGFGTPGYRNSQFISDSTTEGSIQVDPGIFSPDNDGYQDVLPIKYHFKKAGNTVVISIFNSSGQLVRHLENNVYIGTSGLFLWNGLMDNNTKAPPGIYIIFIQVFDMKGRVQKFKKTAVLAGYASR